MAVESAASLVRRQARDELTRRIVEAAREQLVGDGAAGLSVRAVARQLGMASSAVYRYVASRDELLTLLIIEAYDSLGAAAERAERRVERSDLTGRWMATCRAVRAWARRHPHEYTLIYGSPVPGYAAPQDTIGPASRVGVLLAGVLLDGIRTGAWQAPPLSEQARVPTAAIEPIRSFFPADVPDQVVARAVMAWTYLFGAVSFELFGHRHNVVADPLALREAFFAAEMAVIGSLVGL